MCSWCIVNISLCNYLLTHDLVASDIVSHYVIETQLRPALGKVRSSVLEGGREDWGKFFCFLLFRWWVKLDW
jgi:hypothetical protein